MLRRMRERASNGIVGRGRALPSQAGYFELERLERNEEHYTPVTTPIATSSNGLTQALGVGEGTWRVTV